LPRRPAANSQEGPFWIEGAGCKKVHRMMLAAGVPSYSEATRVRESA
jgi:hypothetical protein